MKNIIRAVATSWLLLCAPCWAQLDFLKSMVDGVKNAANKAPVNQQPAVPLSDVTPAFAAYSTQATQVLFSKTDAAPGTISLDGTAATTYFAPWANGAATCRFSGSTVADLREQFRSGSALLVPVYRLRDIRTTKVVDGRLDVGLDADWPATQRLHDLLSKDGNLRLLPIAESRKFDASLRSHLSTTMREHMDAIFKSMGSDGGLLPMLAAFGKGRDASDANEQIAGPFNQAFYPRVLAGQVGAGYLVSTSDALVITAYFNSLLAHLSGAPGKIAVPAGGDLTVYKIVKSVWDSYFASFGYLVGAASQTDAEGAAVGSASRFVKIIGEELQAQWRVIGPEFAWTASFLDDHARSRAENIALLSVVPVEVFANMRTLGYNATKLQCFSFDKSHLGQLAKAGEVARATWDALEKEAVPVVGIFARGYQSPSDRTGRGCVGWGCNRTVDVVRDARLNTFRELHSTLPVAPDQRRLAQQHSALVQAFAGTLGALGVAGRIESTPLK